MPENADVWRVFEILSTQARTAGLGGFIGLDYGPLPFLLTAFQIPESEWLFTVEKLNAIVAVAMKHWQPKEKPKK